MGVVIGREGGGVDEGGGVRDGRLSRGDEEGRGEWRGEVGKEGVMEFRGEVGKEGVTEGVFDCRLLSPERLNGLTHSRKLKCTHLSILKY